MRTRSVLILLDGLGGSGYTPRPLRPLSRILRTIPCADREFFAIRACWTSPPGLVSHGRRPRAPSTAIPTSARISATGPQGDQAYPAAVDFLKGSPCPTAVVARNDLTALAVVDTATDLGLQVPGGLSRDQHILPPTLVVRRPCFTVPGSGQVGGPRAGIGRR